MQAKVDGTVVKVGDVVYFKSDVEQCGTIAEIRMARFGTGHELTLTSETGFSGEYIGGQTQTVERARDCWL